MKGFLQNMLIKKLNVLPNEINKMKTKKFSITVVVSKRSDTQFDFKSDYSLIA